MSACHAKLMHSGPSNAGPATAELRHEHEIILRGLALLDRAAERLQAGPPPDEATLQTLVGFLQGFADRCHHGKEEHELFPVLEAKGVGSLLSVFREEHEEGRGYLRTLATPGPAAERAAAARRYSSLLRAHIERENEILFPMAEEVLSLDEHDLLARRYEEVERETMGVGAHDALLGTLARLETTLPE